MATTALFLPGWDEQSIIGTDELAGGWFAQLWRNGSASERPNEWVNTPTAASLYDRILAATRAPSGEVEIALSEALAELKSPSPPALRRESW